MKKIVFFDLDGTLIDNPSSEKSYILWLILTLRLEFKQYYAAVKFIFRWFRVFKSRIFVRNKAYLCGLPVEKTTLQAKQFTAAKLFTRIRPSIKKILDQHIENGDIVILLTGAPISIAETFAEYFKISEIEATIPDQNNGYFTDMPPKQHPYGLEKLSVAKKSCSEHKISIDNAIAYANSIHDRFLLNAVGKAIAVTPDRRLRRLALAKNWEIIDSL